MSDQPPRRLTAEHVGYRDVLRLPGAKSLLVAGIVGQLPVGMLALALVLAVEHRTGSYTVAGLAVGAHLAAIGVVAPLWGRLIDRRSARGALMASGAGFLMSSALLAGALLARTPIWTLIAAVIVLGATRPALLGAMQSLWSRLAPTREVRDKAFSLHAQELAVVWIVGPLVVSGMVAASGFDRGPVLALVTAGALGCGGAFVVARRWRPHRRGDRRKADPATAAAPRSLYSRAYVLALVSSALFEVTVGAAQVAIVASAKLTGRESLSGLLVALWFAGCVVGGVVPGPGSSRPAPMSRYRRSLLALAASYTVYAALPNPWLLAGALVIGGMALSWTFSAQYSLIADLTAPAAHAEGFNWLSTMATGGAALGAALAGPLIERFGHSFAAFLAAASFTLAAVAVTYQRTHPRPL